MKLSFLSCGLKEVRRTMVGNTHCWGVVRAAVMYVVTSLKLFSFWNVENRLFSLSLKVDNDKWATEII